MINQFKTTIEVRRIDICDLMLACLAAKGCATDGGAKWDALHDKLKTQLDDLDSQLDAVCDIYA